RRRKSAALVGRFDTRRTSREARDLQGQVDVYAALPPADLRNAAALGSREIQTVRLPFPFDLRIARSGSSRDRFNETPLDGVAWRKLTRQHAVDPRRQLTAVFAVRDRSRDQ